MTTKLDDRERRLETIMVADIVGYSRLMDADEEGTYTALRAGRSEVLDPKIEEYGAHVVKHLGDGFLAEFPTAMAAIQFAMSFQEEMGRRAEGVPKDRQIKLRIGVNLGDVIVDEDGDIFGDGVNVAARLEALAIPGGICISGPVFETVHKQLDVDFDDLGKQSVKNIASPVHAYDVRWAGEAGTPEERIVKPTAKSKPVGLIASGAIAVVAVVGLVLWQMNPIEPEVTVAPERSIAVLPFVNMSDDPGNEYFSDGISEELLNLLTKIPELRVAARTSSFFYKDKLDTITLAEVAHQLQVAHILEGSVRKSGNQVRITVQLIKANDGFHLWSETYDRTLDNIFAIQDEIASEVVAQLKIALLGNAPTVRETDPQAYALFLQARQLSRQDTEESLARSHDLFQQVLKLDSGYAAAWSGLATSYQRQASLGLIPVDEGFDLAREAANRALVINPDYAPALGILGQIHTLGDRDLAAAARYLERALTLEPSNIEILRFAASLYRALGRLERAIAVSDYMVTLDPVNNRGYFSLGMMNLYSGKPDAAITALETALSLSPGRIGAQVLIGEALMLKGEPEAALKAILQEDSSWRLIDLPMVYHALGRAVDSDAALADLIEQQAQEAAYNIAYVLAFRGEADRAFEWLDKAVQYDDPGLADLPIESLFANIHDDPRWLPFLESIGMSPEQLAAIKFEVTLPE